jgi:hypothetical protein
MQRATFSRSFSKETGQVMKHFPAHWMDSQPAYHQTPESKPADVELEPPAQDGPELYRQIAAVVWRSANLGVDDAHWCYRLHYFHWGRHMRELALYLHARQFG